MRKPEGDFTLFTTLYTNMKYLFHNFVHKIKHDEYYLIA